MVERSLGVYGESLQCVDATEAGLDRWQGKLINGLGVAVGELPLLRRAQRAGGVDEAERGEAHPEQHAERCVQLGLAGAGDRWAAQLRPG